MGMFDTIKCNYPISGVDLGTEFQSKAFPCGMMDSYTITKEGKLILHKVSWDIVPEEERPYYGKPEWDSNKLTRAMGSMKTISEGDEVIEYHGIVNMYTYTEDEKWFEFNVKFTDGKVVGIERIAVDEL